MRCWPPYSPVGEILRVPHHGLTKNSDFAEKQATAVRACGRTRPSVPQRADSKLVVYTVHPAANVHSSIAHIVAKYEFESLPPYAGGTENSPKRCSGLSDSGIEELLVNILRIYLSSYLVVVDASSTSHRSLRIFHRGGAYPGAAMSRPNGGPAGESSSTSTATITGESAAARGAGGERLTMQLLRWDKAEPSSGCEAHHSRGPSSCRRHG